MRKLIVINAVFLMSCHWSANNNKIKEVFIGNWIIINDTVSNRLDTLSIKLDTSESTNNKVVYDIASYYNGKLNPAMLGSLVGNKIENGAGIINYDERKDHIIIISGSSHRVELKRE